MRVNDTVTDSRLVSEVNIFNSLYNQYSCKLHLPTMTIYRITHPYNNVVFHRLRQSLSRIKQSLIPPIEVIYLELRL